MFAKNIYFLFFWYLFFAKWFQTEKQLFGIPKLFNSQYREKNYGYAIITAELVVKIFYFWKKKSKISNFSSKLMKNETKIFKLFLKIFRKIYGKYKQWNKEIVAI